MKANNLLPLVCLIFLLLPSCASHDVVTYAEFRQIKPNMTIAEVERIVGQKGTIRNGEFIDGALVAEIPGEKVYYWINKDGSNLSITVLNGKVTGAAQSGLN